jgi:hypothetical protein
MLSLRSFIVAVAVLAVVASPALTKDVPVELTWPPGGNPALRLTFGKFKQTGSFGNQQNYTIEVAANNLWSKVFDGVFTLLIFDSNNVRIGEGWINLSRLRPGESAKFPIHVSTLGKPATFALEAREVPPDFRGQAPPKIVGITVYSVPSGAPLKVDGKEVGTTPIEIKVGVGKHELEFSLPGYHTGRFPLVVTEEQVSGGSVTYELGGIAHDTVELRDGSSITGDLHYVDADKVVVQIGGEMKSLDRNLVKRILLVQRAKVPQP